VTRYAGIFATCLDLCKSHIWHKLLPSSFCKKLFQWVDGLYDWLIDWLIDLLIDWLIDWFIYLFTCFFVYLFIYLTIDWLKSCVQMLLVIQKWLSSRGLNDVVDDAVATATLLQTLSVMVSTLGSVRWLTSSLFVCLSLWLLVATSTSSISQYGYG